MKLRVKTEIVLNGKEAHRMLKLARAGHEGESKIRSDDDHAADERLLGEYDGMVMSTLAIKNLVDGTK